MIDNELQERYNTIHEAILAGPNRDLQEWVDSGVAWHLEGAIGRAASDALAAGALVLGPEKRSDYWGNVVPAWWQVKDEIGSPGSVTNAEHYQEMLVDQ